MKEKRKYLLNIKTGKIHCSSNLCGQGKRIAEENRRWSNSFEELANFYEGTKKGVACGICFRNSLSDE